MPKIVVNACYGGFGLSEEAITILSKLKGEPVNQYDLAREDRDLVEVVEMLGERASGDYAKLRIADVPEGVEWFIDEYDGIETVAEKHRSW